MVDGQALTVVCMFRLEGEGGEEDTSSTDQLTSRQADTTLDIDQTMLAMDQSIRVIDRTLQGLHQESPSISSQLLEVTSGQFITAAGQIVDGDGSSYLVDSAGHVIDAAGHIIDATTGQIVDDGGHVLDASGQIIDSAGRVIDAEEHLVMLPDGRLYPSLNQYGDPLYPDLQFAADPQYIRSPEHHQYMMDTSRISTESGDPSYSLNNVEYNIGVQYNPGAAEKYRVVDDRRVLSQQYSDVEYSQPSCDLEPEYTHIHQHNQVNSIAKKTMSIFEYNWMFCGEYRRNWFSKNMSVHFCFLSERRFY